MSHLVSMLAQSESGGGHMGLIFLVVFALLFVTVVFGILFAARYTKVGPNEVLIISGRTHRVEDGRGGTKEVGFRIKKGGGTFVVPVLEKAEVLSLELMTIDVKTPSVYSISGVPVRVDGVAQIKVRGEETAIRTAAEQFLSKTPTEVMAIAHQTLEGHLRAIIGKMTVEELYKDRDKFAQNVQSESASDFANMGLQIVSFTIKEIQDDQGYLDALGKPKIAEVKKEAIVGQSIADREATIQSSKNIQAGQEARFLAETAVAQSKRDYEMKQADYQASINQKKAESDLAYDLQKFKSQQAVKQEEMKVLDIEKEQMINIKQKELQATIQRPAEAERFRIQQIAEAAKFQTIAEAEARALSAQNIGRGEAEAVKAKGLAEAEAVRAKGLAEAEVILAKGQAEAESMRKKAEAWRTYTEAAIAQMFIEKLPELARAIAEPLGRTDKITIISNGGDGIGASKVTKDIVDIIAQLPPVLESVSGVNLKELIGKIPGVTKK
ncbi:MAG TPA: SPFH domain-containing protein [Planctomycetota bacterium]|nr:SPFH domain-containing protein [Planctomycetota bacterium]